MAERPRKKPRSHATAASVLVAICGSIVSWLVGAIVVRLGLNWADTFEYSPASEWRYLGVAILALTIATSGSIGIARFSRRFRRERLISPHLTPADQ